MTANSTRQNLHMTRANLSRAGSTKRGRVAGGRIGHRTAQTLSLQDATYWSVLWWAHKRSLSSGEDQTLVGDIYDEALVWFFTRKARAHYEDYLSVPGSVPGGTAQKRSFWVDSRLVERAEKYAQRDGMPRNRVLYTAFTLYIKEFAPAATEKQIEQLKRLKSGSRRRGRPIATTRARTV